jgi:hypothetical protein
VTRWIDDVVTAATLRNRRNRNATEIKRIQKTLNTEALD